MPQIREYTAHSEPMGPLAPPGRRPSDGYQAINQGIQTLGEGVIDAAQAIQNRAIQSDTDKVNSRLSDLYAKYASSWSDTVAKADPNDSTLASKFIDKFDEDSSSLNQDLTTKAGRQYFNTSLQALRSKFVQTANVGQSELHRVATQQNYLKALDNSSSALMNDPTSFGAVKLLHDNALNAFVQAGALPRDKALELQTKGDTSLAQAAVRGLIQANPGEAKAQLDSGAFDQYLPGQMKHQLYNEAQAETRVREIKQKELIENQKEARRKAADADYTKLLDLSTQGKLNVQQVLDSQLTGPQKRTFINAIQRNIEVPNSLQTDPDKFHSIFNRITNLPDNDPAKIKDPSQLDAEFNGGGLSYADLTHLRKELANSKTDTGKREQIQKNYALDMMKQTIYRSAGPSDPKAPELYLRAQQAYNAAYENGVQNGKTPAELTDPDFVKKIMRPFVPTPQKSMENQAAQFSAIKSKQAGKSPQDIQSKMAESLRKRGLGP